MADLIKRASRLLRKRSSPLKFPTSGFETVHPSRLLEEERFEQFKHGQYYPAYIGELISSRYQIVGKLGFGATSTVWLARDLEYAGSFSLMVNNADTTRGHEYVTLKIYSRDEDIEEVLRIYKQLDQESSGHAGHAHIRKALDIFTIPRSGGDHPCFVQRPMWESFRDLLYRNANHRFPEELLKSGLTQIFLALDYLHTECKLVHTGKQIGLASKRLP